MHYDLMTLCINVYSNILYQAQVMHKLHLISFLYSTSGGVIKHEDGLTVTAPTIMWVEVSV